MKKLVTVAVCKKCGKVRGENHNPYMHLSKSRTGRPGGDFIKASRVR